MEEAGVVTNMLEYLGVLKLLECEKNAVILKMVYHQSQMCKNCIDYLYITKY